MSAETEHAEPERWAVRETLEEQRKRRGLSRNTIADLRNDEIWETDEELAEFLAYLDAQRHGRRL
jgi:hypothetical protein